jgi:valyl-tRNA synthetase
VRDAERQKMSKTKGNVIDPLVVTEKYGTDAVRMALLQGAAPGTDIVLTEERMESSRAFANKIWNAARFSSEHGRAQVLWHFFWHEFCDWYVELKKLRFQENSGLTAGWRNLLAAFEITAARRCGCCIRPCRSSPKSCGSVWPYRARPEGPAEACPTNL